MHNFSFDGELKYYLFKEYERNEIRKQRKRGSAIKE